MRSANSVDLTEILHRPPRILIADDDWLNRDLLETYLTTAGGEVMAVSDGLTALEHARETPPDVALVDVQMPRMDGLSLCRELKNARETQFVPVIIVTALDSEEEKLKAIEAGADDFVSKPYNSVVLLTRVRSLLRLKKLNDEVESRNHLLRQVLNRFVAEDVADTILTDPERYLKLGGEIRPVTVLFADISGFTAYTERHSGPQVIETLNRLFPALSQVVFAHKGTFDKYLGDGLMAFYGAPVAAEDDAARALATAVEMQRVFGELREQVGEDFAGLSLSIGLHSGEAIVGNVGSEEVMDYTVIGDVVNVAKRLQEEAGGDQILLSEATLSLAGAEGERDQRTVRLTGRVEPITAYLIESAAA